MAATTAAGETTTTETTGDDKVYDLTIIGGGPTGLYCAFYAGLRQMSVKSWTVCRNSAVNWPRCTRKSTSTTWAASPRARQDLVQMMSDQALQYSPAVCLSEKVTGLHRDESNEHGGVITLTTDKGRKHRSRTVVIAAGVGAFLPRKMDVPGLDELEGRAFSIS
jgi:thioredoxin reductase (NADPH)